MAVREDGLTRAAAIREATASDASGIARVHVDAWRATYRGIVPDAHLDAMSHVRSELRWCERLTAPDAPALSRCFLDNNLQQLAESLVYFRTADRKNRMIVFLS